MNAMLQLHKTCVCVCEDLPLHFLINSKWGVQCMQSVWGRGLHC